MKVKRLFCLLLCLTLLFGTALFTASAENEVENETAYSLSAGAEASTLWEENGYSQYAEMLSGSFAETVVLSDEATEVAAGSVLSFEFIIEKPADYEFCLDYRISDRAQLELSFAIDGAVPFEEAGRIAFQGIWQNSEKRYDGAGNEIAPEQMLSDLSLEASAKDLTGKYNDPYLFCFGAGTHEITLTVLSGKATINSVKLSQPETVAPYQKPDRDSDNGEIIMLEGEAADFKSAYYLVPMSNSSSATVSPCDPMIGKLNYIGGSNWKSNGDTLIWKFNVKKSGYYSFAAVYRQNINLGAISYRHLKIDGRTPFEEAATLKFKYSASWSYYSLGKEEPYLFWLDAGTHTLSLSVTSGEMAEIYAALKEVCSVMGDLYIDITMLVGETVDTYRSYELFNQIPDYNVRMNFCLDSLKKIAEKIEKIQEKSSGSAVSNITGAAEILEKMLDQPYSAHKYQSAFYNAYTNLGALVGSIVEMPLDIDRIYLVGDHAETPDIRVPLPKKLSFSVRRFFVTFTEDYDTVSASETSDSLTIWVNWGRDQAQVLTALINQDFTLKYGIDVNIKVVNATLIQGILAGKGPDVMLHMARTEPVNLAMRGALENLAEFEDFESVIADFSDDALLPYEYSGGTYALPDSQTFDMLFIRTDIFEDLKLKIPTTWDEFSVAATEIQRNNLQVYLPGTFYSTLLAQNNLPLYDMEQGISTLTGAEQIQCFIGYTDWFTKYKFPKTMDSFFNRFRIGNVPMGISNYTLITQLEVAAPEIADRWTVATLPGVVNADGVRNYTSSADGTGCGITKLSDHPENAWLFLKWWVSPDVQEAYSNNLESLLGPMGRVATASNEAFVRLGWSNELMPALLDQKENIINLAQLPGGYYVTRGIDQAYWNVVEQNANPVDTMLKWGEVVNEEMRRKKAEYS